MDYSPWFFKRNQRNRPMVRESLNELPPCTFGEPLIAWANDKTVRE